MAQSTDPSSSIPGPSRISIMYIPPTPSTPRRRRLQRSLKHSNHNLLWTMMLSISLILFAHIPSTLAQASPTTITVYTAQGTISAPAPSGTYTGLPAYDPTILTAPGPPQPPINSVAVALPATAADAQGANMTLSKPQQGNFLGFSIELSVAPDVLGKSSKLLSPVFLNYMANIQVRAGQGPIIRVGGNTQDSSSIYPQGFPNGTDMQKIKQIDAVANTVDSPIVNYAPDLLYTMSNISALVDAHWYFGLAFNESDVDGNDGNIPLAAQWAEQVLGDRLLGLVIGNEPDLYVDHNHRPAGWNVTNYITEYDAVTQSILADSQLQNPNLFVGPSVCCQTPEFGIQDVINAGMLSSDNAPHVAAVTVQHYPTNNCQLGGVVINPQDIFNQFLNHSLPQQLVELYAGDTAAVLANGKDMVMLETNTASCGGFPGLSDSFGAAMWMTDYALQMAYGNFSAALIHFGGQGVYYNPFTPPPGGDPSYYEWTTGSIYYAALVVAETFGQSNASQIVDLEIDYGNIYHPAYAIYENGNPTRLVLFNYVSDPTGASDYQASVTLENAQISSSVSVRYLRAPSVSEQFNITWAGQNMGTSFASDGKLKGTEQTVTVQCPNGECTIPVYAPSIALVFLTDDALTDSTPAPSATQTYATTIIGTGSATINPAVLETSNGENGPNGLMGSNSEGSISGAGHRSLSGPTTGVIAGLSMLSILLGRIR